MTDQVDKVAWKWIKRLALLAAGLILAGLYWQGALRQLRDINTDMGEIDQSTYMQIAERMVETGYRYDGSRNQMPLYPFVQSLFYDPGMSDEAFFEQGKTVNLILSMALLAALALILWRYLDWGYWLNLMLMVAFTVFIFKAGWFQSELLFYFLSFCLFLLLWRMLQRPSWPWAVLTGLAAGLAHLTKASILPALLIFFLVAGLKWSWSALRRYPAAGAGLAWRPAVAPLLVTLLAGLVFLLTIFPYIRNSKRIYGQYFYNVNSTFYLWYDSWPEVKQGTWAAGDREGWPDLPAEAIPGPAKYVREHTAGQMVGRVVSGGRIVGREMLNSYGYYKYMIIYAALLVVAVIMQRKRAWRLAQSHPFLLLFLALYFGGYALLYFWYAHIAAGNRLILALFLPFMFSLSYGLQAVLRPVRLRAGRGTVAVSTINNGLILMILAVDIYFVLTRWVGTIFGGF